MRYTKLQEITLFGLIGLYVGFRVKNETLDRQAFPARHFFLKPNLAINWASGKCGFRSTNRSTREGGSITEFLGPTLRIFKHLGGRPGLLILLTTHSQRTRVGGQQGIPGRTNKLRFRKRRAQKQIRIIKQFKYSKETKECLFGKPANSLSLSIRSQNTEPDRTVFNFTKE